MHRDTSQGVTLLELLVTISIASILLAIAAPSMSEQIRRSRLNAAARDMLEDLAIARSEAVTRALPVTVCTSADAVTCSNDGWTRSRIVFVDQGVLGAIDGSDLVLKQSAAPEATVTGSAAGAAAAGFITYLDSGGVATSSTVSFCTSGLKQRDIGINTSGRAASSEGSTACP